MAHYQLRNCLSCGDNGRSLPEYHCSVNAIGGLHANRRRDGWERRNAVDGCDRPWYCIGTDLTSNWGTLYLQRDSRGGANGVITGAIVAVIAAVFNQSPLLGLVIGVAMVLNLVIAGFFGALVPLGLDRLGYDPATSATIFITTATDVLGFFIFLGLAQLVLL